MIIKAKVIEVKMGIKKISKDFAYFRCGEALSGLIHTPAKGNMTVILDGGCVLGEFDCVHCAIDAITELSSEIIVSNERNGMDYKAYKKSCCSC